MGGVFPNALHVARREYLIRVRGRAFAITTGLLAIAVLLLVLLPTILTAIGIDKPPRIAIAASEAQLDADPVPLFTTVLTAANDPSGEGASDEAPSVSPVTDTDAARAEVEAGDLDGLLIISRTDDDELAFEYVTKAGPTSQTRILVEQAASSLAIGERLEAAGIPPGERAAIFAPPSFTTVTPDPSDASDSEDFGRNLAIAYILVILTFMAVITYGNWVAQSVAEEKSSRVMELLITAATPRQLLTGKILGTGAAGLTQYAAILLAVVVGFLFSGSVASMLGVEASAVPQLPELNVLGIAALSGFFLGGFILYSTLYAAAGSMVSRLEDVQQAAAPLMFLAMAGYFSSFAALSAPDASWVGIASLVPFFSPYLMPVRMLLADPTQLEIGIALIVLLLTILGAIWVASRIYSAGVLLYGQRLGWRNVLRATRVSR
ncbi:MAG: ABC transporter permease [Chloroflexota bacterium]